jgi:hypothetical protein
MTSGVNAIPNTMSSLIREGLLSLTRIRAAITGMRANTRTVEEHEAWEQEEAESRVASSQ